MTEIKWNGKIIRSFDSRWPLELSCLLFAALVVGMVWFWFYIASILWNIHPALGIVWILYGLSKCRLKVSP